MEARIQEGGCAPQCNPRYRAPVQPTVPMIASAASTNTGHPHSSQMNADTKSASGSVPPEQQCILSQHQPLQLYNVGPAGLELQVRLSGARVDRREERRHQLCLPRQADSRGGHLTTLLPPRRGCFFAPALFEISSRLPSPESHDVDIYTPCCVRTFVIYATHQPVVQAVEPFSGLACGSICSGLAPVR